MVLYWFPLLSTNIKVADTIFDIYLKVQSFQSNRSLISGVLLTTGTIQNYKKSKTQKVKVAEIEQPLSLRNTRRIYYEKKSNWILQFSSPFSPRPLLLPCPKCLLTEARKASSFSPVVVNFGLREQGSSSQMLLMATCSKKILVLGWAPPGFNWLL